MKRIAILAVAAAFVTVTASASGTPARSSAGAQLQSVIVTLRSQADLSGIQGSRATRLREVILRRQAKAGEGQRLFAALFQAWQGSGVVTRVTPLWVINGFAITARPEVIKILAQSPAVASVTPDETMYAPSAAASAAAAEWNVSRVNAPALWDLGVTGQGVVVATLDSGVDVTHADLSGRWRGGTNSWYDPFGQHTTSPMDRTGHGTQVMGLMVGGDAGGTSVGVAPGARWIAARIYNDAGQGTTSNTHLAFQWLLDPDHNPNTADAPQVVNNSWTYGSGCNLTFAQDIQTLRAAGILPVFAAGNSASLTSSPANNPGAMAVGSTTSSDTIASYSSRGPSACGEPSNTFPELTAPGDNVRTTDLYGGYATFSGTSMAAPHVAGALALLLSAYPNLTAAQQENALELGAHDLGTAGPDNTFGYGRLDVLAAYNALSSPNFSLSVAPSSVSAAAGATATYAVSVSPSGGFAGDVALSLTGLSASQASWTFTPAAVTGGSGSSQLAITTSASLAVGSYPLTITGTSGSLTHTVSATLVVSPPPDFGVVVAPSSASTAAGGAVAYSVVASSQGGFAGDISLSLDGLTAEQATWSFAPSTVTGGSGSSQLTITTSASLAAGSYPLTITGTSGSVTHTTSATLVVPPSDFGVSVSPSSASTTAGGAVSYTVSVSSLNGFAGAVSLSLGGLTATQASWSFTPATLTGGAGTSQLTITTAVTLAAGSYPLTITGTSGSTTHTTTATLAVVPPPDFGVSVSPSSASTTAGGAVSYTVSVSSLNGFAGGVSLSLGGLTATQASWSFTPAAVTGGSGSSQLAITTSASLAAGSYPLTITGTSGSLTHTASATLVVSSPPDFGVNVSPSSASTTAGGAVSYTVSVSSLNGFAGAVSLSLGGLTAAQASWTFTPATVTGGAGSSQLKITSSASLATGSYPLTITGTSGSKSHTAAATLVVSPPADFTLAVSPSSLTVRRGAQGSYVVTVSSVGGFSSAVSMSVSGLPSGVSGSFSRNPVTPTGQSTLVVRAQSWAQTGTFTITIRGTAGSKTHTVTATLRVTT